MTGEAALSLVHSTDPQDPNVLLALVALGDQTAFAQLFDVLSPAVYGIARRVVRDPARAEDVAQEVFLEVWRKAPTFDRDRGSAKTWVLTIAHRRAVDLVRRNETQRRYDTAAFAEDIRPEEPSDAVLRKEEHTDVRECLDTLTELQLEAVRLAYYSGYTYAEVASLLDKPLPTIKTRMRDGMIRLRDCLEEAR